MLRRLGALAVLLAVVFTGAGCRLIKKAADVPGQAVRAVTPGSKGTNKLDVVDLQQQVARFADEFSLRMFSGIVLLQPDGKPISKQDELRWKIAFATETCAIASGPNAVANLLDMTMLVTSTRMALEEHWIPNVVGESGKAVLEACRNAEADIWEIVGRNFSPDQMAELREAVDIWQKKNPLPQNSIAARAVGFASEMTKVTKSEGAKPMSVLQLLMLDPLAGLDPAAREIAETRLFAERGLYVVQKMPMLLRWQTELFTLDALSAPEVQQVMTNSTEITAAVQRLTHVVEKFPEQVSHERAEILKALEAQERQLTPLVGEVRQTLAAGSQMSDSLNTTLGTFGDVLKRLGVGEPSTEPPKTNAEPFRILDYGQTAQQLGAAADHLTELLDAFEQTLASTNLSRLTEQVNPAVASARDGGKELVDYAFWRGVLLVIILLVAALAYKWVTARIQSRA